MPKPRFSSSASSRCPPEPCWLEWRPSRWQARTHQACLLLALAAIWRAQLPWIVAITASVLLAGMLFLQWRRAAVFDAPTLHIMIPPGDETVWVDGVPVDDLRVSWQGPLVQVRWRGEEGVMRRLFWPDVLGPAERRELRLAIRARRVPRRTPSMAP